MGSNQMKRQYDHLYKSLCVIGAVLICFFLLFPAFRMIQVDVQSSGASAETNRETALDIRIGSFFETLKRGKSPSAFEELLLHSPLGSASAGSQIAELQNQVDELRKDFGDILNWEESETKRMGKDVVVVQYILKYEQCPVLWSFVFYRAPTSAPSMTMTNPWILVELRFDTNIL
jgi:hypothetical protein